MEYTYQVDSWQWLWVVHHDAQDVRPDLNGVKLFEHDYAAPGCDGREHRGDQAKGLPCGEGVL